MSTTHPSNEDEPDLVTGFGEGGVPWPLLLFYLSFLVFFTWYTLEYQLPRFLDEKAAAEASESPGPSADPLPAAAEEDGQ